MNHYHIMGKEKLEREYSPSSCIDDIAVPLGKYSSLSHAARVNLKDQCHRNVKYGPEERAHMDIFAPKGDGPFPVHIFIHGGYWQELSKEESSFAAPNFLDHNIIFIALDYTLAPDASLSQIIDQVRQGMRWIVSHIDAYGGDKDNITLSGSSAGAHLVAEILNGDGGHCPVKGACMVSGIYDLRPLVLTYVINAGGIINVAAETRGAYDVDWVKAKVDRIYETLTVIFDRSVSEARPTNRIADELAEEIIEKARAAKA